jgi:hypothetical protein
MDRSPGSISFEDDALEVVGLADALRRALQADKD